LFDKVFGAIKSYHDENGDVMLCRGKDFYFLSVVKYLGAGREIVRERGRLDAIAAAEFFEVAVRYVRGEIEWTEPVRKFSCKYNPNKSRGCTDKNCPKKLGGADYREIFGAVCPFRKSKTR
jgi:hypothetical protein